MFSAYDPVKAVCPVEFVIVIVALVSLSDLKIPGRRFVELRLAAVDGNRVADIDQRLRRLGALFDFDQRLQLIVRFELLLDAGKLHELLGELVGVERIERVLVLQLRGQQRQEGLEIIRDPRRSRRGRICAARAELVPGAETTVVGMVASTAMAISLKL